MIVEMKESSIVVKDAAEGPESDRLEYRHRKQGEVQNIREDRKTRATLEDTARSRASSDSHKEPPLVNLHGEWLGKPVQKAKNNPASMIAILKLMVNRLIEGKGGETAYPKLNVPLCNKGG